jgi:hypothetical protein
MNLSMSSQFFRGDFVMDLDSETRLESTLPRILKRGQGNWEIHQKESKRPLFALAKFGISCVTSSSNGIAIARREDVRRQRSCRAEFRGTEISAFNAQNQRPNKLVRNGIRERRIADQEGSSKILDWIVYGEFLIAEAVVFAFAVADCGMTVPTSGVTRHSASPCARMSSICVM